MTKILILMSEQEWVTVLDDFFCVTVSRTFYRF